MDSVNTNIEDTKSNAEYTQKQNSDISKAIYFEKMAQAKFPKFQELHGEHVKQVGLCAIIKFDGISLTLRLPFDYPELLTAIIKRKYSADQVEAITANYLNIQTQQVPEDKAAEYISEYNAYQEWRKRAKEIAKEIIGE